MEILVVKAIQSSNVSMIIKQALTQFIGLKYEQISNSDNTHILDYCLAIKKKKELSFTIKKNLAITHRFPQCSGYHVRLTRERSLVRNQAETILVGILILGLPCDSDGKEYACNVGDPGLIPGLGRSPGEENGTQQIQDDTEKIKNQQLRALRT